LGPGCAVAQTFRRQDAEDSIGATGNNDRESGADAFSSAPLGVCPPWTLDVSIRPHDSAFCCGAAARYAA